MWFYERQLIPQGETLEVASVEAQTQNQAPEA